MSSTCLDDSYLLKSFTEQSFVLNFANIILLFLTHLKNIFLYNWDFSLKSALNWGSGGLTCRIQDVFSLMKPIKCSAGVKYVTLAHKYEG